MSTIYASEPPTLGKVVLVTTHGDIDIELWSKETPRTCRNFVQLCLDGVYDSIIWHRIVKELLIQSGDPTGLGTGGEDIYGGGEDFATGREVHPRLRFSHRGQVAMAGPRGSQFFVSLAPCAWLNGKHAIFGKVTGDTIFSTMRIAELDVDAHDRPTAENNQPRIIRVDVLSNPFPDLFPRKTSAALPPPPPQAQAPAPLRRAAPTSSLLSFTADDDEDDDGGGAFVSVSVGARASGQRRGVLSFHEAATISQAQRAPAVGGLSRAAAAAQEALADLESSADEDAVLPTTREEGDDDSGKGPARLAAPEKSISKITTITPASLEFAQLVAKMKGTTTTSASATTATTATATTTAPPLSALAAMRASYDAKRCAPRGKLGETAMLARLAAFQDKLAVAKKASVPVGSGSSSATGAASYHGQLLDADDTPSADGLEWASGKLSFVRHVDDASRGVLGVKRKREGERKLESGGGE